MVEELRLVDGDDVRHWIDLLPDLRGGIGGDSLDCSTIVAGDRVDPRIAGVEMRFENLDSLPGDYRATDAAYQLLALPTEHHARNDFDPATTLVERPTRTAHEPSRSRRGLVPRGGRPRSKDRPRSPRSKPLPRSPRGPRSPRAARGSSRPRSVSAERARAGGTGLASAARR